MNEIQHVQSWLIPRRRDEPELMDQPGLDPEEILQAYRGLERVNWMLGNRRTLEHLCRRELQRLHRHQTDSQRPEKPLSVLDVGAGSGDLLGSMELGDIGRSLCRVSLDRDQLACIESKLRGLVSIQGDATALPFSAKQFELVIAVKFAHHFVGESLERLLAEMCRVSQGSVVILDIVRHWVAYHGFRVWSQVFTRSRLVRHDGPLSVLRGFTKSDLRELSRRQPQFTWSVERRIGFQIALIGRRIHLEDPHGGSL